MAFRIGEVADRVGVGIETIRFYERQELIDDPPRTDSGYRQYPDDTVTRIRFIRRAKELGFSLKEISDLLQLRVDPTTSCEEVKERAEKKIAEIEQRIRDLRGIREALTRLAASCTGRGPTSPCPILDGMEAASTEDVKGE